MKNKIILITSLIFTTLPVLSGCNNNCKVTIINNNPEMGTFVGDGVFKKGTEVKIEAIPYEYYDFVKWEFDERKSSRSSYTFNVEKDITFYLSFEKHKYNINLQYDDFYDELAGTISGDLKRGWGEQVNIDFEPYCGYKVDEWLDENDEVLSTGNKLSFEMPQKDLDVKIKYAHDSLYFGSFPQKAVTDAAIYNYLSQVSASDGATITYQDHNYYRADSTHYFSFDPVEWDIIEETDNSYVLISSDILAYVLNYYHEYSKSNIRNYLIHDFYDLCFSPSNQNYLVPMERHLIRENCDISDKVIVPWNLEHDSNEFYGDRNITFKFCTGSDYWNYQGGRYVDYYYSTKGMQITFTGMVTYIDNEDYNYFYSVSRKMGSILSDECGIRPVIKVNKSAFK